MQAVIPALSAALSLATSIATAALFVAFNRGETGEMVGLAIWTAPLCLAVAIFASKPRWRARGSATRAVLTGLSGFGLGIALTALGLALMGGWMLAWDFPVFICWSIAGTVGALASGALHEQITWPEAFGGALTPAGVLAALAWYASRPQPAVLLHFRKDPDRDAAQFVWDSVLTRPHQSGSGRELPWDYRSYSRWQETDSGTTVLVVLERASSRDPIRAALAGHPLVRSVVDTSISP